MAGAVAFIEASWVTGGGQMFNSNFYPLLMNLLSESSKHKFYIMIILSFLGGSHWHRCIALLHPPSFLQRPSPPSGPINPHVSLWVANLIKVECFLF